MTYISTNVVSVNVSAPVHTKVQYRPVTHVQRQIQPEPVIRNTKVIEVARPVHNVQTVIAVRNIDQVATRPEVITAQSTQGISFSSTTSNTNFTNSGTNNSVDIIV